MPAVARGEGLHAWQHFVSRENFNGKRRRRGKTQLAGTTYSSVTLAAGKTKKGVNFGFIHLVPGSSGGAGQEARPPVPIPGPTQSAFARSSLSHSDQDVQSLLA
jgi:hypothetical protein